VRLSRLVGEFRDVAQAATTAPELAGKIEDVELELGFEFVAVLHSVSLFQPSARLIRYENYPAGWDRRLVGRGYKIIDPILTAARRRVSAFCWPDALSHTRVTHHQHSILADAARHGIRQGITIPANVPGEPEGSVSFATCRTCGIRPERVWIAEAVGRIAFEAARRIAGLAGLPNDIPHVGDRVRECIYWIAHGKTDQDIADILGIGLETVRTYVKSAFRLFSVITRGQLVHEALRLGVIDFVPSIPPFG
jgi:LuxR family quorum-sensing system transcriptional regulator CciR